MSSEVGVLRPRARASRQGSGSSRTNRLAYHRWPKHKKTPNRLINIHSLELQDVPQPAPAYAILSHRWSDEEITLEDYVSGEARKTIGHAKIVSFCKYIRKLNRDIAEGKQEYTGPLVEWVWVDTCCIDKRSSAELSEAVNSMAAWYKHAAFCVAYLNDVTEARDNDWASFRASEWFTRGWTLQELVFPQTVIFCNHDWEHFLRTDVQRGEALALVSEISGVPLRCLDNSSLIFDESVANRMSWAAERKSTRKEDEAYCLLGLLDINMPLIYGEGEQAFIRLQEEIIKQIDDESIFAWTVDPTSSTRLFPVLARSPVQFGSRKVVCRQLAHRKPYSITNKGLELHSEHVRFVLRDILPIVQNEVVIIELNCCFVMQHGILEPCLIALTRLAETAIYHRVNPQPNVWAWSVEWAMEATYESARTFHIAIHDTSRRAPYRAPSEDELKTFRSLQERFNALAHSSSTSHTSTSLVGPVKLVDRPPP